MIIVGDPHLGKGSNLGKSVGQMNSRFIDQMNLLDWSLDQAMTTDASIICLTGDVFDDPKPHHTIVSQFMGWLKKCQSLDITVHIVVGNHDILRHGNYYYSALDIIDEAELENIFIHKDFDTVLFDGLETSITFLPFRDRKSFNEESSKDALVKLKEIIDYESCTAPDNYTKVAIGHLALEGSVPVGNEVDDLINELFISIDYFKSFNYTWLGHIHKPQVLCQSPYIAHIGSMDISDFGESEHKKYIVIYDFESKSFVEELIPTRTLQKIDIVIPDSCEDATEFVFSQLKERSVKNSIVSVNIEISNSSIKPVNRQLIQQKLFDSGVFSVSKISEARKVHVVKKSNSFKKLNLSSYNIDVPESIKLYADSQIDESERDAFIETALEIFKEHASN